MLHLRIGTRGSSLAIAQAKYIKGLLELRGIKAELKVVRTRGDKLSESFLEKKKQTQINKLEEFGLFVKELDEALLRDEIDIAVHSMKDMPMRRPEELEIAAVIERETAHEAFVAADNIKLEEMRKNAVIGTSSIRRKAQILRFRGDLVVKDLRGNVNTRLRKLKEGEYEGGVIAEVGLHRLGLIGKEGMVRIKEKENDGELFFERLPIEYFIPAANQGIIGIVARKQSEEALLLRKLDNKKTRMEAYVEKRITAMLGGGCKSPIPIGVYAKIEQNLLKVMAEKLLKEGKEEKKVKKAFKIDEKKDLSFDFLNTCASAVAEKLGGRAQ